MNMYSALSIHPRIFGEMNGCRTPGTKTGLAAFIHNLSTFTHLTVRDSVRKTKKNRPARFVFHPCGAKQSRNHHVIAIKVFCKAFKAPKKSTLAFQRLCKELKIKENHMGAHEIEQVRVFRKRKCQRIMPLQEQRS